MDTRSLDLSDLATEQEAEIIKNPYQFLELSIDASLDDVRRSFIHLSKKYHPDLINPSFDSSKLRSLYKKEEIEKGLNRPLEEIIKDISEISKNLPEEDPQEIARRQEVFNDIRNLAHKKMVLLNRAYQEIKSRYNPREWNTLFGYETKTEFNEDEKEFNKVISLEGDGKVIIYPKDFEYWVAGPYLRYDWGIDEDNPWDDADYRDAIAIKHLFAHMEIKEGKKVSEVLLKPFFNNFRLDKEKSSTLIDLLSNERNDTEKIMKKMGISEEVKVDARENWDKWLYGLKFRRHLNEILFLKTEPSRFSHGNSFEIDKGKLTLYSGDQSNFSEADYLLFVTLAYGPLLSAS